MGMKSCRVWCHTREIYDFKLQSSPRSVHDCNTTHHAYPWYSFGPAWVSDDWTNELFPAMEMKAIMKQQRRPWSDRVPGAIEAKN